MLGETGIGNKATRNRICLDGFFDLSALYLVVNRLHHSLFGFAQGARA